ncbi:MAG: TonB-dependent receptor [Tannerella sp.]|jgi:TonB-linked SusC/RagA family outer membrane protein|nr:TonB-dependent receptor [Tannerella sp.]
MKLLFFKGVNSPDIKQKKSADRKKISILLCMIAFVCISASASVRYSLETKITLNLPHATVKKALEGIRQQTEFSFWYRNEDIDLERPVSVVADRQDVRTVLNQILAAQDLSFAIDDRHIIIYRKSEQAQAQAQELSTAEQQQGRRITGTVVDAGGEPVIGANIVEKGVAANGTVTDVDGNFSLTVADNAVLQISFIGYVTQEVSLSSGDGNKSVAIRLIEDEKTLEEVVVVGYGTQKKVNLTGAVSSVSSEVLNKRQVGQTSLALQGVAPGVTVTQRNGQPGVDGGDIRIRGVGTLNNSSPLILVDGLEMGINNLDVNTIESISILKDAASASIYGSKAANGVILITTKRAQRGAFNISYSSYVAQQTPTNLPEKVNALDHILLLNESKVNSGAGVVYTDEQINQWKTLGSTNRDLYPDTDWQKEVLTGNGFQQNHNLTLTGGTEKLRILASLGYMKQNGIIENVNYERISLRLNTDILFTEHFSSTLDLFLYNGNRNSIGNYASVSTGGSSGVGLAFAMMNKLPAVQAVRYSNGLYAEGQNGDNPVASIHEGGYYKEMTTPVSGNISFKWEPVKEFRIQTAFSPSISYPLSRSFIKQVTTYNPDGSVFSTLPAKSNLTMQSDYNRYLQSRTTANWQKAFASHNIAAMAGFQYESNYSSGFSAFRDEFLFPEYSVLQSGSVENMRNDGWAGENVLLSYFGRINYDFKGKYLLEANIRHDGSSKFAKDRQWGTFPSFSAGWRLSEENFWENVKPAVQNFKIRGSYGLLGNQNISGNYAFSSNIDMSTKYVSNDQLVDGASILTMNNSDITWETTAMSNIGLDATLLNRINLTFNWFYKKTTDILMVLDVPRTIGLEPTWQNAGAVENKGFELDLSYADKIGDFDFDVSLNLSDVRNKILDLKGINGTGLVTNREGHEINSLYMYRSLGILTQDDFDADGVYRWTRQARPLAPGDLRYANLNDDDIVNADDLEVLGSTIPRYTFGFNFNGRYRGIDLSLLLQGVGKADGYLGGQAMYPFWSGSTAFEMHRDRWTEENQNTRAAFPRLYFYDSLNNYQASDFYLRSAAYLRLKNLQLGYTLPVVLTKKWLIQNLRFYISGENLLTLTSFWDGWDPEISPGSSGNYYPQVKTVSAGVDIKF